MIGYEGDMYDENGEKIRTSMALMPYKTNKISN
jgi:hypothetical protein